MTQINTDKARQGRWGSQVLVVLVCGLLLAAVAWFVAEQYGEAIETPATAEGGGAITTQPQPAQQ